MDEVNGLKSSSIADQLDANSLCDVIMAGKLLTVT